MLPEQEEKLPLGVAPKVIWYEQRINDLARAIHEYVASGRFEKPYWWSLELTDILRCRERHLEQTRPAESFSEVGAAQHITGQVSQ